MLAEAAVTAREDTHMASHTHLERSAALKARAESVVPSCTQTFSKGPSQFVQGVAPVFLERGSGSHVWDVDGNEYIDTIAALGAVILGYGDPDVTRAARTQLDDGVVLSLPHPLEVEVAELLVDVIPCAEMVRFGKNGSDATAGAVRAARAFTGRDRVACCGYHGWQDWYIGTTTRSAGVPRAVAELAHPFGYNDLASLERIFSEYPGEIAAVILEPVGVVEPQPGFLEGVRALASREGAVLVFDEVITGFRLALGGAQELFGVVPDLACIGKALGNGFPISAVVGRRDIMAVFDEVFFSFTYGGDAVALAVAKAVLQRLRDGQAIEHLWRQGARLRDGYNELAQAAGVEQHTDCHGLAPRTVMSFRDADGAESLALKSIFQQEVLRRGVLSAGYHNVMLAHSDDDVERMLDAYRSAVAVMAEALADGDLEGRLEGPPVQPVFRSF
jgi:glutamate-1-semialdehyde aminotransferase